ncbi:polysaccharide pyruvyl transferase family protein [Henriciella aquimarina]|uniref:polysaccharide pyruvyl transferase family protein n=1 Tax=Henriciella aquimarina TaxID=545261 RepID=UPI000A05B8E2|nr:polysaccharide pyruvyl transferase family protein [Henriciella aquimarina]
MKLVLLNVKFSPNLGDGIIAECLEWALREADPTISAVSCDLAGRTAFGDGINQSRRTVYAVLDRLPKPVRRQFVEYMLKHMIRTRLREHYDNALKGADAALIGGGQLIADADLNFPLKISAAVSQARQRNVQVGVYGAGVGGCFSEEGHALFDKAFGKGLVCTRLRDEISVSRWRKNFAADDIRTVHDPGMLARQVYGPARGSRRKRPLIGVGITNPSTLNLHADEKTYGKREWRDFFIWLCEALVADGYDVQLFTNGAHDDHVFADFVFAGAEGMLRASGRIRPARTLTRPAELAHLIGSFDGLVAHRLHAAIVAYSYGVPHVGLGWDSKMDGFFSTVGRQDFLISDTRPSSSAVCASIGEAMRAGIDEDARAEAMAVTRGEVRDLVGLLKAACLAHA